MTFRKMQQENIIQRLNGEQYARSRSRVFNVLASLQGNGDQTRPISQKDIARLIGMCRRTVIYAINELVEDGQLIALPRKDWVGDLYLQVENVYKIVKRSLADLKVAILAKAVRDKIRKEMVDRLRQKKDLSAKSCTPSTNSQNIERTEQAEMPFFAVSDRLLRSKLVSG